MTNLKKQIFATATSGIILLNLVTPAFAETSITIKGNGDSSDNNANITRNQTTTVVQSNTATVSNNVSSNATSGGNDANRNTGGDVTIDTGSALSETSVKNELNLNRAHVDGCCDGGDVEVKIKGNGVDSRNTAELELSGRTDIYQDNEASVYNNVDSNAKTGYNDANRNTGGDVYIVTGDAKAVADVKTKANANIAVVGGSGDGGSLEADIKGNGDNSSNTIDIDRDPSIALVQANHARVRNDVDADAISGKNDANRNTGGDFTIDTGMAWADVEVDTLANFNLASVDCECVFEDVEAKVKENGVDSRNTIEVELGGDLEVFQGGKGAGNGLELENDADSDAKSGKNDLNRNTGEGDGDPLIYTGNSRSNTRVENAGNVNVYGPSLEVELPGGVELDLHFDLNGLLGALHLG
jgi:hypothetical protein